MQAISMKIRVVQSARKIKFSESGERCKFQVFFTHHDRRSRPTEFPMIIWIFHMEKN